MGKYLSALIFFACLQCVKAQSDSISRLHDSIAYFDLPLFSSGADQSEGGTDQQELPSLLQSARDPYMRFATFQWSTARFRIRGLPSMQHAVLINGADISNPETGSADWSTWGGLNDVTRAVESRFGQGAGVYNFSPAGGFTNIDSRAITVRRSSKFSYSLADRIFRHRILFTHHTGLNSRGWAFSTSVSARHGDQVQIPGTFFRGYAVYASLSRRINHRQNFSLTAFATTITQGRQSAATMESFQLASDNSYNPAWGRQNGQVRNANVSSTNKPTLLFTHHYLRSHNISIISNILFQGGKSGLTGLSYWDAPNPRPDYYRNLPSYFYHEGDSISAELLAERWKDEQFRQIDWDRMIHLNRNNFYSTEEGQVNNTETLARYVLERKESKQNMFLMSTVLTKTLHRMKVRAGASLKRYSTRNYKVAEDLLGATFLLDVDPYAEPDAMNNQISQNDLDNINRKVRTGERFGYDYSLKTAIINAWAQAEGELKHLSWYLTTNVSATGITRTGHVANGKFPGQSKTTNSLKLPAAGIRAGISAKANARNYFSGNAGYYSLAPATTKVFLSPSIHDQLVPGISTEKTKSIDLNYHGRFPSLVIRTTLYRTITSNGFWQRSFWHDEFSATVNMVMKNVTIDYSGVEFCLEKNFMQHALEGAFALADARYQGRPVLDAWKDDDQTRLIEERIAYLDNYAVSSAPQVAAGVAYKYRSRKYWHLSVSGNLFGRQFIEANPDRRTAEAISKFTSEDQIPIDEIVIQQQLPAYFLVNLSGGKSWRLKRNGMLALNAAINNLTNNQTAALSAYEQLRWSPETLSLFAPKFTFFPGRIYILTLSLWL